MQYPINHNQQQHRQPFIPDDISEINERPTPNSQQFTDMAIPNNPKQTHLFGGIHITYLMYIFLPILLLAPMYTYHMAVKSGEQRPYPHSTITNTACYYPQDITFRGTNLPAGSFICLIYYAVFKWVDSQKKRIGYPGDTYSWMHPWAQASVLGFLAAIGTIDGAGYPDLHSYGAVFFFVLLFFIAVVITLVLRDMHEWDSTVLNRTSFITKSVIALYLILMVLYCVVGALLQKQQNDDNIYLVILQWNLVFVGLLWLFTFKSDWNHVFVTLRGDISSTVKQVNIEEK